MEFINTHHKFSHIGEYCFDLSIYYKHIAINDIPVNIVLSVCYNNIRFVTDECGKLYLLTYNKGVHLTPKTAVLLYDASVTGICIKKIFYEGSSFLILDEDGNLYGCNHISEETKNLNLLETEIDNFVKIGGFYFTINIYGEISCRNSYAKIIVEKYKLNSDSIFFFIFDHFCHVVDGNFCTGHDSVICTNVKHVDTKHIFPKETPKKMANPISFICSDSNNTIYYSYCCDNVINEVHELSVKYDISDVFITSRECYGYNWTVFCYITPIGIFEIKYKSGESNFGESKCLTPNVDSYIINIDTIVDKPQIKSAAKI